jgi:hypothetical protein
MTDSHALTLLQDLVAPGTSNPESADKPIIAPLPLHIEIATAFLIHPRFTNQASSVDHSELASQCITFLRNVLAILGPINANLDEAYSFTLLTNGRNLRRSKTRAGLDDGSSGSGEEEGHDIPQIVTANSGRIRKCAKDFWHMVGWAFNCSIKFPQRWKYWKVWLEYMLDVLDADWYEREEQDLEATSISAELGAGPVDACNYDLCGRSLLVKYLSEVKGGSSAMKRVVRSIFTNGSLEDMKEFPEVWENETKEAKRSSGQKRKRDAHEFGDCEDEEPSMLSDITDHTPEPYQESGDDEEPVDVDQWLGGTESIILRQRVLVLVSSSNPTGTFSFNSFSQLSRVAAYLPDHFIDLIDVYDAIYCHMRRLPLPAFSLFLSPSGLSHLPPLVFVSLTQLILLRLLPNQAPRPHTVSGRDCDSLSQHIIETCFLPFAANTHSVSDNARVSILIENMFRYFLKHRPSYHTPSLDSALEKGIMARENKAKGDKKKKKDHGVKKKEDQEDWVWLKASGERLRTLHAWVEQNSQDDA